MMRFGMVSAIFLALLFQLGGLPNPYNTDGNFEPPR